MLGFDSSDWEEDGERSWDVMRALDYLLSLKYVDAKCVLITGLSMGGEITTITVKVSNRNLKKGISNRSVRRSGRKSKRKRL